MYARIKNWIWPEPRKLFLSGLDAAGKTTLLYKLKLGEIITTIPTIGFNVETITHKGVNITSWDLGGCSKLRPLFRFYFPGVQAVVFIVDSNDRERLHEVAEELKIILEDMQTYNSSTQGFPVLVYANKQDLSHAMSAHEISEKLALEELLRGHPWVCMNASFHEGKGVYEGLDWLVEQLEGKAEQTSSINVTPAARSAAASGGLRKVDIQQRQDEWMAVEDEPDEEFLQKFENYTLENWDHRVHLRLAWLHLITYGRREGLRRILEGIQAFIDNSPITRKGAGGKGATFHCTMTYFWTHMVHHAIATSPSSTATPTFKEFLKMHPHLADGGLFLQYYSKQLMLLTPESRVQMKLPDVKPLPNVLYDADPIKGLHLLVQRC